MISREAHSKFNEYCGTLGPYAEVYTDGSKIDERVGAAAVIIRHFQNGEITCRRLSKRLPDNSTIFAAEATAITLALDSGTWSTRITWWSLHWWLQNERESGGSGGHQPPFPEWWDNLPPTVQKTARQQHHLCSWGYSHQSGTELLSTHGPSPSRCGSLLWLNVLFAGNWGWRHWEPFYLPYHEPALVIAWQGHTCSFLLGTKPLWHWRKWKSGSTSKRDPRPRYRPTGKCPLYRYETTDQLLHSEVGSNQVGCSCTWQRSLSCETNTGATEEVRAPDQGRRGCNNPTSNWPYQGHQIPYLVPRTTNWLSPLW